MRCRHNDISFRKDTYLTCRVKRLSSKTGLKLSPGFALRYNTMLSMSRTHFGTTNKPPECVKRFRKAAPFLVPFFGPRKWTAINALYRNPLEEQNSGPIFGAVFRYQKRCRFFATSHQLFGQRRLLFCVPSQRVFAIARPARIPQSACAPDHSVV